MPFEFICPSCGRLVSSPQASAGKRQKCAACWAKVTVPADVRASNLNALLEDAKPPPRDGMGFKHAVRVLRDLVTAAGRLWWWPFRGPKGERYLHFRCPYCDRRLRFGRHLAGRWITCPACKHHFALPAVPAEEP